jgi:hypothetical protein
MPTSEILWSLALAATALVGMLFAGGRNWRVPLGLQAVWVAYIVANAAWTIAPVTALYTGVYGFNVWRNRHPDPRDPMTVDGKWLDEYLNRERTEAEIEAARARREKDAKLLSQLRPLVTVDGHRFILSDRKLNDPKFTTDTYHEYHHYGEYPTTCVVCGQHVRYRTAK